MRRSSNAPQPPRMTDEQRRARSLPAAAREDLWLDGVGWSRRGLIEIIDYVEFGRLNVGADGKGQIDPAGTATDP